jgi:hypothetical protein
MQLYRYFVTQSSDFYHHNPLCCFSTSVFVVISLSTQFGNFGYTFVIDFTRPVIKGKVKIKLSYA